MKIEVMTYYDYCKKNELKYGSEESKNLYRWHLFTTARKTAKEDGLPF